MAHDHDHDHDVAVEGQSSFRLALAFFLNLTFSIIEVIAGLGFNSTAILADAVHNMSDNFSLGLAWTMQRVSKKKRDTSFSYGYKRFSTLAALINSIILLVGSGLVLTQAIPLLFHPEASNARGMILIALVGIVFNGIAMLLLRKGSSMNEKVVTLHQLEDVLTEIAIVIVGTILIFWHIPILDPILSVCIVGYLLYNGIRRLWQVSKVFLQSVPEGIDIVAIENVLRNIPGVKQVHDTHAWSLDGEHNIITTHIVIAPKTTEKQLCQIKSVAKDRLHHLGGHHVTLEIEREGEHCTLQNC